MRVRQRWTSWLLAGAVVTILAGCGDGGGGALPSTPPGAVRFFVSPQGNDAADGTEQAPFRTLERARNAVRGVPDSARVESDVVVTLAGGFYRLEGPLRLEPRDSGRHGHQVVYQAAPGEVPTISGGTRVQPERWSLQDAGLNIYGAQVGARRTRQLYVNGRRATRSRTEPYPLGFLPSFLWLGQTPVPVGILFKVASQNPARWRNPATWTRLAQVEAVILLQWKMASVVLDTVIPEPGFTPDPIFAPTFKTGLLTVKEPGWTHANVFVDALLHQPGIWSFWHVTRFENAYEFLDEPGEWYLNEATGWLYYIPRPGEDMSTAQVEVPLAEALIDAQGTREDPVADIRFEGLTFAHATWLDPSSGNGYVADQSGFHLDGTDHPPNVIGHDPNDARTPGNVRFRYAHRIMIRGNMFEHLGGVALDFDTGCQDNTVVDNLFSDISSAAIQVGGISRDDHHPQSPRDVTRGNVIANNLIRGTGRDYLDSAAVYLGFTEDSLVRNNTIIDVPWSGIAIGWGWGLLDPGMFPGLPGASSGEWGTWNSLAANRNNKIIENRIQGFLYSLWDGGAIYATGRQGRGFEDGLLIEGNVASGKRPRAGGNTFYTDGGSRFVTLRRNVSYDNPQGVTDLGPPPRPDDPLPYSSIPSLGNCIPYGSDTGGCRTYGDIRFVENYWLDGGFFIFTGCEYSAGGVSYPTDLSYLLNHLISGASDVPRAILSAAGVRYRPSTIPPEKWDLAPVPPPVEPPCNP